MVDDKPAMLDPLRMSCPYRTRVGFPDERSPVAHFVGIATAEPDSEEPDALLGGLVGIEAVAIGAHAACSATVLPLEQPAMKMPNAKTKAVIVIFTDSQSTVTTAKNGRLPVCQPTTPKPGGGGPVALVKETGHRYLGRSTRRYVGMAHTRGGAPGLADVPTDDPI
jgi:hypothetical protein